MFTVRYGLIPYIKQIAFRLLKVNRTYIRTITSVSPDAFIDATCNTFRVLFETSFQKRSFLLVFSFMYIKFAFADRNVCTQSPREMCRLKDRIGGDTAFTYSSRPGFHSKPVHVGFVVDKVAVLQVFLGVRPLFPASNIPQMQYTHSLIQLSLALCNLPKM